MKFFTTSQIRELDQFTIENEPIASIDLMERAADALYLSIVENFSILSSVCIVSGQGNNGGDALALARLLLNSDYTVNVLLIHTGTLSPGCETNRQRLLNAYPGSLTELQDNFVAPLITGETLIIDGIFGSGLSRPLTGIFADAVLWINQTSCKVVSIDIPSGLSGEENTLTDKPVIVKANLTLSLQFPKLAFFMAEYDPFVGDWEILDIGIHPLAIEKTSSDLFYLEEKEIAHLLKKRQKFSHKGSFGHALIIAGAKGMAGASVLSSKAALRSGAGLVTVYGPEANRIIVQTSNPEGIFKSGSSIDYLTHIDSTDSYSAIAIGPGIGTHTETSVMLKEFIQQLNKPCVFDADALNIISHQKEILEQIPENCILTPHPKEFDRLFGNSNTSYERFLKAQHASKKYNVIIILKGANTLITTPEGNHIFNSTGNPGMATAGSGDVLTGILVSLLAQGYTATESALTGVFLHGTAGDLALETESTESLIAGDIISNLGKAFQSIRDQNREL
jgi:NAD(P)H-hydrate epimerase